MGTQSNETYFEKLNRLGKQHVPFFFLIDFEQKKPLVFLLDEIPADVLFAIPGFENAPKQKDELPVRIHFERKMVGFDRYKTAFENVMAHLKHGDSYLLNLTMSSEISLNLSLKQIFDHSCSLFRLYYKNEFVCFSPEIFVRIKNGIISSYPMKGTIDSNIPGAEKNLLNNSKEFAEHNTIVDLIRNDLSMVAREVRVKRFRYVEKLETIRGGLLQTSSEIVGKLEDDYPSKIGSILSKLLPAGSISGAPKQKTLEIIKASEKYTRGYYTGIFGVFDGKNLESAVAIRYIENQKGNLVFKSGGGITVLSNLEEEYQELCDKVYVPII